MKKNIIFLLLASVMLHVSGADYNCNERSVSYVVERERPLDDCEVEIGLAHLPPKVKGVADQIKEGNLKQACILFVGAHGVAKKTSARCIGQKYYGNRSHFFYGTDFLGDRYKNSGIKKLDSNLCPIIKAAKDAPQFIIIAEFQRLVKKRKQDSLERNNMIIHFHQMMDNMNKTGNIILVGTCTKTDGLSPSIISGFAESTRYVFDSPPSDFYKSLLQVELQRSLFPHVITTDEELIEMVTHFPHELRKVGQMVREASIIAFARDGQKGVIQKKDMLFALQEQKELSKPKPESWEKWIERHEKIHVGIVIAGLSVAIATGVYDYRLENRQNERQAKWLEEDRIRQQQWREEDIRQQELHDQKMLDLSKRHA